jgi:hypothetical protein
LKNVDKYCQLSLQLLIAYEYLIPIYSQTDQEQLILLPHWQQCRYLSYLHRMPFCLYS